MIDQTRLNEVEKLTLSKGAHESLNQGLCIMEMVSYLANEPWSDHPQCSCVALTAYAISLNDRGDDGIACEDFAESWTRLRSFIQSLSSGIWALDTMSRIEDWCATFVIKSKPSNEGAKAKDSLEDYKYKAGLTFVCDEFRRLLGDIDNAYRRGASFVLIAHNRISRVKNPDGSDFIRQEPRLLDDPKGSNMLQFVSFVDNLLFVDLDKSADKGKVVGSGSRTIYLDSSPSRLSKTRTLPRDPMDFQEGSTELWTMLGVK